MDMDNYFLRKPFFQIAPNGFLKTYKFACTFKMELVEAWAHNKGIVLPDELLKCARKHVSLLEYSEVFRKTPLVEEIKDRAEELYEYVRSGEAEKIWHRIKDYLEEPWPALLVPWVSDCNFYMAKKGFEKQIAKDSTRYGPAKGNDLNPIYACELENQTMPPTEFEEKAIRLGGLQQIKSIYIGMHKSYL